MINLRIILLVLAFISFFLATIGYPPTKVNLIALGLALWVLALIVAPA